MKDTRIHIDILIDIKGNTIPLKALVDPGSKISIIKEVQKNKKQKTI
jgi:hypothetical protein